MQNFAKYLLSFGGEILIILLFLFVSNNFLSDRDDLIQADGRGYYEFLPATFIYHDLQLDYLDTLKSPYYNNELMAGDFYKRLDNGKRFDKYFVGTAVLQAPFFAIGHAWAHLSATHDESGFSRPYQVSIYMAALFYTFLGLVFIRFLLASYDLNLFWIFFLQASVIFCTPMLNYMHWDASYSHVYSFFLVSGFLYFSRQFLLYESGRMLFGVFVFLGMIFLVRPVNVLALLFLPFLAENFWQFKDALFSAFNKHYKTTIIAVLTCFVIYQVQCLTWYFQTGHWFYYSYGEETFIWSEPHIADFLFSYRKGFFLWAPWFFIALLVGILFHVLRGKWFRLCWFIGSFMLTVYVLSCWWYWSYGGSIGSRPMIDFYPALIAFVAPAFARSSGLLRWIVLAAAPVCAYVMVIQVYQYQRGILTYDEMDRTTYWKVFLETDPAYEWYLWKQEIPLGRKISDTPWEQHIRMQPERWYIFDTLSIRLPEGTDARRGQITFLSPRKNDREALEIRILDCKDSVLFNHYSTMLHVVNEPRGQRFIDYRFPVGAKLPVDIKAVFVIHTKASPVTIDSMKIRFFTD